MDPALKAHESRGENAAALSPACPFEGPSGEDMQAAFLPNGQPTRVLLVDDDPRIRELAAENLAAYALDVKAVPTGEDMFRLFKEGERFDVLLLDIMLPGEDGLALCSRVRRPGMPNSHIPIIFLSALDGTLDRIVGLELGADDYLVKPFETRELVARIKAVLRRTRREGQGAGLEDGKRTQPATIAFGQWRLNVMERHLEDAHGVVVPLSTVEFRLLSLFLKNPNRVLSRERILDHMCGQGADIYDRSIDVQISRLRSKLRDESRDPKLIRTLRGEGYIFIGRVE